MKRLLSLVVLLYGALLLAGCGGDVKSGSDGSESNQSSAETIDLDDPETRKRIIAEAIDGTRLQKRVKEGEELRYAPNQETPYTGWAKWGHDNEQIGLMQFKDGKPHGQSFGWGESGRKSWESHFKEGKLDGGFISWWGNGQKQQEGQRRDSKKDGPFTWWHKNGKKAEEITYRDGKRHGLRTSWYENGQKKAVCTFNDGPLVTAAVWKPNGEKCPVTNVVNGDGVLIWYHDDGIEYSRENYKDGVEVDKDGEPVD